MRVELEYRALRLRAKTRVAGSPADANFLQSELSRLGCDGWQLVSAFDSRMDGATNRYFVMVVCRRRS